MSASHTTAFRASTGCLARSVAPHHGRGVHGPALVAESTGAYAPEPEDDPTAGGAAADDGLARDTAVARAVEAALDHAVGQLIDLPVDGLDDEGVTNQLRVVEHAIRRLDARRCRLAAAATARRRARAEHHAADDQDRERAGQRAAKQAERELADQLQWSPSEAKRATRVGDQLGDEPEAQAAFDAGRLPPRHAQLLAETLEHLTGAQREHASTRLIDAAGEQDARSFGRSCRRLLAELDPPAADEAEQHRHTRRRARMTQTDDGLLALNGQWAGLDAETLATAIDAFRRPDASGDPQRNAEQRTADAVVELARAALRAGEAPTVHGVRPHVNVTIDYHAILADAAAHADADAGLPQGPGPAPASAPGSSPVVEAPWMGPLPYAEVRRLLADANVSRLLVDADGVPVEAGEQVRTVPAGLWRALVARDGGCIAVGCDAPPSWCDVMHLGTPHRRDGQLTIDTAGLGCRHHHRQLDLHHWHTTWQDRRPTLRPPPT